MLLLVSNYYFVVVSCCLKFSHVVVSCCCFSYCIVPCCYCCLLSSSLVVVVVYFQVPHTLSLGHRRAFLTHTHTLSYAALVMDEVVAITLAGHVLCTLLGMRAVLLVYRMGKQVLGDQEVAFFAACVYCIQPATIFHAAPCVTLPTPGCGPVLVPLTHPLSHALILGLLYPLLRFFPGRGHTHRYSESLFAVTAMELMTSVLHGRMMRAAIFLFLSGATRANGFLLWFFVAFRSMHRVFSLLPRRSPPRSAPSHASHGKRHATSASQHQPQVCGRLMVCCASILVDAWQLS